MGIFCQFLRNSVTQLDGLAAEEGHILFPPGGSLAVVGVDGLGKSRPEDVLGRIFLCPAVGVVGIYVSEHALTGPRDEIVVSSDNTVAISLTLEEEIEIHSLPREVSAETVNARWH